MHHVAIMKKSWGLIPKILDGRKKIESRWSINKCSPWKKVFAGDIVFFKNSGEPVIAKATVSKVSSFGNLNPVTIRKLLEKYGGDGNISVPDLESTIGWAKNKRYCSLIYLKNPSQIKAFNINKKGFGSACAWITVKNISSIKNHN